jgi:hypothetical protein
MAGTFAVQTAVVLLGVAIVRGASRTRGLGRLVGHFWPKARERLDAVRVHASKQHLGRPVLAFTLSRGLELIQYGVIFLAVTGHFALVPVVLSLGVATVAGTLGDAVPVQLGVIGASFAAASGILGISGADAVAFGALAHAFQLAWIAVGLVTPLVWRVRQ